MGAPAVVDDEVQYSPHHAVRILRQGGSARVAVLLGAPGFHDHPANVALAAAVAANGVTTLLPSYSLGWAARDLGDLESFITSDLEGGSAPLTVVGVSSGVAFAALWAFSGSLAAAGEGGAESDRRVSGFVGAGGLYGAFLWPLLGGNPNLRVRIVHAEGDEMAPVAQFVALRGELEQRGYAVEAVVAAGTHADTFDPSHPLGRRTVRTIVTTAQT